MRFLPHLLTHGLSTSIALFGLLCCIAVAPAAETKPAAVPTAAQPKTPENPAVTPVSNISVDKVDAEDAAKKTARDKKVKEDNSLVGQYKAMGTTGYFLTALGLVGLLLILSRFFGLTQRVIVPDGLADKARDLWKAGNIDGVKALAATDSSVLARVIEFLAENKDADFEKVAAGAQTVAGRGIAQQGQSNYWLAVVATIAPLLGLFGTVVGMIDAFQVVAVAGDIGDTSMVAEGIYKALVTTEVGLLIAMPTLATFHYMKVRLTKLTISLEDECDQLIMNFYGKSK